jgi:peptidoglycan/xylan/chitin deacetylase (PgdA/CDA1 family)
VEAPRLELLLPAGDCPEENKQVNRLSKTLAAYPGLYCCARWLWAAALRASGALWWAERRLRADNAVIVLMLHRVVDDVTFRKTCSLPAILLRKRTFERLARCLATRFEVVALTENALAPSPRKLRMALTFDDGWADNFGVALPIALEHGLPSTVFICPAVTGTVRPFWPERVVAILRASGERRLISDAGAIVDALKRRKPAERERWLEVMELTVSRVETVSEDRVMTSQQIRKMAAAGVRFGSHTQTHSLLTRTDLAQARYEITASKEAIERMLGHCDTFSYPNGDWSPEVRQRVEEAGYSLACTTDRGAWTAATDRLAIPRANVSEENVAAPWGGFSLALFAYTTYWKAWRAERRKRLARAGRAQAFSKPRLNAA